MRPLLAWALLCIPPKIAALQAPSHGARPFSRPSIAPRSMLRLEADDDCLSNFWRFWGRISDPLNAPSPQTGLSLIQSFENAFAAGQKVACYDGIAVGEVRPYPGLHRHICGSDRSDVDEIRPLGGVGLGGMEAAQVTRPPPQPPQDTSPAPM